MAVKFMVQFEGARKTPFVSGAKQVSLRRFVNYLVSLMSGSFRPGGASIVVRNAAVSATATVTFAGAATAADTVTVNGQALTATQKNATATVEFDTNVPTDDETVTVNGAVLTVKTGCARATAEFSTIVADNVVTVNGTAFTAKVSPAGAVQFALGASDTEAAANLATKINAHPTVGLVIEASSVTDTVHLKAIASGTAGNALTLAKTGAPITVSGDTFEGGVALENDEFDPGDTVTQAARQFKECINASTDSRIFEYMDATSAAGVVTMRALAAGTAGNALTLETDGADIAVSDAVFENGAAASNNAWDPGNSAATAGEALKDAINASTTSKVSAPLVATHNGSGVVTLTAQPGVAGNMFTLAKSGTAITVSGAAFTGGSESTPFRFSF